MSTEGKRRVLALLWSALAAFLILFVGQTIWGLLLSANFKKSPQTAPWSVAVMTIVLWIFWQYLGGRWWPRRTSAARKRGLRANSVSKTVFAEALLAGVLSVVALAGLWIVFFQLVKTPANVLLNKNARPVRQHDRPGLPHKGLLLAVMRDLRGSRDARRRQRRPQKIGRT